MVLLHCERFQGFPSLATLLSHIMPPRGASRAAPKVARAAPKSCNPGKSAAPAPEAPADRADRADHVDHVDRPVHTPLDPPVTPPPRPRGQAGRLYLETPGEQFPPVSPGSSDSNVDVAVTEDVFAPPILISPIKRRQRQAAPTINRLTDLEVWDMTDQEIIGRCIQ